MWPSACRNIDEEKPIYREKCVVCGACEKVKYGWVGESAELGKDSMSYL